MRKSVKVLVVAAIAALGLSACSSDTAETASDGYADKLVVGDVGGWIEGHFKQAGLLEDLPYDVEFKDLAGASVYATLSSSQVDVGVWGFDANGAKTITDGSDARIVALIGREDDSEESKKQGNINLFVSKKSGINSLADLAGKTIGVNWGEGTTADVILHAALAEAGLTKADLDVKYFTDASGNTAYLSGQLDGFITSVNAAIVEDINAGNSSVLYYANEASAVSYVIASTENVIADEAKKKTVADWVTRTTQYYDWRAKEGNLETFGQAVANQMSVDERLGTDVASYIAKTVHVQELTDEKIADYQSDLDNLKAWGLLDTEVKVDQLVNTAFADAISSAK